ncbi:helix-turn-helix transcriptional regulator [Antrihabitans spumae]|uniref:Helix-turn-helix transcriptional regulator n=1 Tax=Antrihabitans spumae TaxID=3373370 RepID=A0ABW7KV24_9NOCA
MKEPFGSPEGGAIRGDRDEVGRREAVLATLREGGAAMPIAAMAKRLDVHPNTVRFHLEVLVANGRAERVEPDQRGPGRPPLLFRAVRRMDPGGSRRYQVLAEILTVSLAGERNAGAKARAAGRMWARRVTQPVSSPPNSGESVDRLVDLLAELGFAPQRQEDDGEQRIGLRHCPFLEVAQGASSLVCSVHLGLMQGALEAWDAPVTVDRLEPFVEPGLCLAHVASKVVA